MQRRLLLSAVALAAAPFMASGVLAQAWPARPIKLVVPFPPGGLIDNMARLVAPKLGQELGQAIVIDNKPGAGGNLGAGEAARATPDGYTLLMASPPLTINPALYSKLPYKPENIVPLGLLGRVPNVPTMEEAGLKGYQVFAWFGLAAPAGLPAPVQQKIEQALERVAQQPEVKAAIQKAGAEPTWVNAQGMASFMQADTAQWKKVADYAKIALD